MTGPSLPVRYMCKLCILVLVAGLVVLSFHRSSLPSDIQKTYSLKEKLSKKEYRGLGNSQESVDNEARNINQLADPLQGILSRYPWLRKHNFMPNYFTLSDGDRGRYKDDNVSIVFVHNPKAGGRTMKSCLDDIARRHSYPTPTRLRIRVKDYPYDRLPIQKFYVSEFTFGYCDTIRTVPCSYFTLLRDPYERLISCYDYCNVPSMHDPICGVGDVRKAPLQEWAAKQGSHFFRQLLYNFKDACFNSATHDELVRDLGELKSSPCWYLNKLLLDKALTEDEKDVLLRHILENLERWFTVIGLVDEFELSLRMLEEAYGLPFNEECAAVHISRPGVKVGGAEENEELEKMREMMERKRTLMADSEVSKALERDVRIYEKAKEIFQRQKNGYLSITR